MCNMGYFYSLILINYYMYLKLFIILLCIKYCFKQNIFKYFFSKLKERDTNKRIHWWIQISEPIKIENHEKHIIKFLPKYFWVGYDNIVFY